MYELVFIDGWKDCHADHPSESFCSGLGLRYRVEGLGFLWVYGFVGLWFYGHMDLWVCGFVG